METEVTANQSCAAAPRCVRRDAGSCCARRPTPPDAVGGAAATQAL
jgi:hypothetical protein